MVNSLDKDAATAEFEGEIKLQFVSDYVGKCSLDG